MKLVPSVWTVEYTHTTVRAALVNSETCTDVWHTAKMSLILTPSIHLSLYVVIQEMYTVHTWGQIDSKSHIHSNSTTVYPAFGLATMKTTPHTFFTSNIHPHLKALSQPFLFTASTCTFTTAGRMVNKKWVRSRIKTSNDFSTTHTPIPDRLCDAPCLTNLFLFLWTVLQKKS